MKILIAIWIVGLVANAAAARVGAEDDVPFSLQAAAIAIVCFVWSAAYWAIVASTFWLLHKSNGG